MINWLEQLRVALNNDSAVILVTVIAVRGSAPREVGAKLLISDAGQRGTVGGGNLEYQAVALARDMLKSRQCTGPDIKPFALGPSLGQCCGGYVELMFERITCNTDWFQHAIKLTRDQSRRYWLCRPLSTLSGYQFVDDEKMKEAGAYSARHLPGATTNALRNDSALPFAVDKPLSTDRNGKDDGQCAAGWWFEKLEPTLPQVWVFGAGHVGRALHEQLQLLPCHAVAIDSRDEMLEQLPSSVRVISTDSYADEVETAPAGVWFIVMTHSHTVDFDICHSALKRTDFAYLGLIGSATKRATFASRLANRGIDEKQIDRLISPIGLPSIQSRLPQLIALGVAADLAHQWQVSAVHAAGSS